MRLRRLAGLAIAVAVGVGLAARQGDPSPATKVDQVFARWTDRTPGCVVGVSLNGQLVLEKGYGLSDLEHDIHNVADTVFEAGSVSKQFTAAAVLLLAKDGRLSLDDPVRKYVPELPDYGSPLTIRHMLTHTSGLRDWGNVVAIAGWPRTSRVYTHAHVLDVVSRQRSLNFTPGTRYSYSNSGYNLAAIIVSRVSGQPFADFTRDRIFNPLGMTRTSWRDDYTRVVKGRAIAYAEQRDGFHADMPFENVHGNGGLLTTVGDLLRWTRNFSTPAVGDAAFVREQQEPGRFTDGRPHGYALGLQVGTYRGVREVGHSGSTAGYRAHLATYPAQGVAVAVLCNVSSGAATQSARAVAEVYLTGLSGSPSPSSRASAASDGGRGSGSIGLYRNTITGQPVRVDEGPDGLRLDGSAAMRFESGAKFSTTSGRTVEFAKGGVLRIRDEYGTVDSYERVPEADQRPRPLSDYLGDYTSTEAEITLVAALDGDTLVLRRRPDSVIRLTPLYADTFRGTIGLVRFHRGGGQVTGLSVTQDRVWDLRFERVPGHSSGHAR
jgi:CubicO group peptidase (beta-lactamase class C family)